MENMTVEGKEDQVDEKTETEIERNCDLEETYRI